MAILITSSKEGIKFTCSFEGFRSKPYKDGGGIWTIGYGTVLTEQQAQQHSSGITVDQAKVSMQLRLNRLYEQLADCALNGLSQGQYDAIIDLCYNIGFTQFQESTIYQRIRNRSYDLSPWLWFVKDTKGRVEEGLIKRRQAEMKLFIYGLYQ